jgi:pimeloyl-ACP methyl ester carboxylesterase
MKKDTHSRKSALGPKVETHERFSRAALSDGWKKFLGPRPFIRYSHSAALKVFEGLGFKFEVRHFGESRLGLLRWPLRKPTPGKAARRLVMVPGFGDTPLSWWTVLAALKPVLSRRVDEVILVDYPGYSGFLHNEAAFDSMDELQRVFREVMDSLKPQILMGHSLGGWLCADYAAERPDVVSRLILVDPGGLVGTEAEQENYRKIFEQALETGSRDLLQHVFKKAPILLPFFEEEFFAFLKSDEVRSFIKSFDDRHILNAKVANIRAETTIVWGEHDTMTPTSWLQQWLDLLPADRKKVGIIVRGSGHSPQVEKPGVLIALFTQIILGREPKNIPLMRFWKVVQPKKA